MANKTLNNVNICIRRDNQENWNTVANTVVLKNGEIGLEIDTRRFKVGNGATKWGALNYYNQALLLKGTDPAITGALYIDTTNAKLFIYLDDEYVECTMSVDSALSSSSTNPVQNKVINTALGGKVDKIANKGLSTEDFTSELKSKLEGIEAGANKTTVDSSLSPTSTNPVQNKIIYDSINELDSAKVDKVTGKGLSTNDFTTAYKDKLDGIEDNANNYVLPKATSGALGGVKINGGNLSIDSGGTLSVVGTDSPASGGTAAFSTGGAYTLQQSITTAQNTANTAKSIAEGRNRAVVKTTITQMVSYLWGLGKPSTTTGEKLLVGDNIYIIDTSIPDFWCSILHETQQSSFTWQGTTVNYENFTSSNEALFKSYIASSHGIKIGYYEISELETSKVDLSGIEGRLTTLETASTSYNTRIGSLETASTSYNTRIGDLETSVNNIGSAVTSLEGYFTSGKAKKAIADEDGTNIKTNYISTADVVTIDGGSASRS